MARKKKETSMETTDVQTNGTHETTTAVAEALPVAVPVEAAAEVPPPEKPVNGDKRGPLVSYRLNSDRTTSIEVAVWSNTYTNGQGEEYEQLTMTVQRSYKDAQNQWQTQTKPSWRVHDLPCLLFLLNKAYSFALNRRCDDSTIPF